MHEFLAVCSKIFFLFFPVVVAAGLAYWLNSRLFSRQTAHNKKMRQQELFLDQVSKTEENIIRYWDRDASDLKLGRSVVKNIELLYKLISVHGEKFVSFGVKEKLDVLILDLHRVATGGTFQSGNMASPDTISKALGITGEMKIFLFD